ncbi:MAG: hypothetical protein ACXAB4_01620 [Candidatus Hodarchaeales archaeon]
MTTEIPVKASTIVFVTSDQIIQYLRYFYLDSDRIYRKYELTDCLNGELERMEANLQIFLDQDAVFLNETDCNLQISEVRQWYLKEDFSKVLVEFVIRSTPYQLCSSPNKITLESELEKAPYPCFSAWFFPGKVLAAKSVMKTITKKNRILLRARTEEWIGGRDEFMFDARRNLASENLFAKSILFSEQSELGKQSKQS